MKIRSYVGRKAEFEFPHGLMTVEEAAVFYGLQESTLIGRLKYNEPERAVTMDPPARTLRDMQSVGLPDEIDGEPLREFCERHELPELTVRNRMMYTHAPEYLRQPHIRHWMRASIRALSPEN